MKKALLLAAFIAASAGAANATDFTVTMPLVNGVYTGSLGDSGLTGTFTDTFTFDLPVAASGNLTLSTSTFGLTFDSATVGSYTLTKSIAGPFAYDYKVGASFGAGPETLTVVGTVPSGSGSFSGTLTFTPSAVPEPASWAMMIGGIGVTGGALRRRKFTAKMLIA